MDLDLVRHALAAARRHGYAEVELGVDGASFSARLARAPKAKAAAPTASGAAVPADDVPKALKATLVGYFRDGKAPLAVGRTVKRGEVVGMIEALGIVTEVPSNVEGEVVEVLVEPGQAVEYGQVLAKVKA